MLGVTGEHDVDEGRRTARFGSTGSRLVGAVAIVGAIGWTVVGSAAPAFADTPAYELYCPGTPIGNIVLNGVITTGTLSGSNLTNYQTQVTIPLNLVTAASAFGSTLSGSATAGVDATGATPATIPSGTLNFNVPIPNPVAPITLKLPTPAGTIGPFTATGGSITLTTDPSTSLTLLVSGNPLTLTCKSYANNALPTGTATAAPPGNPVGAVIATGTGTAAAATPTTAPPTAASSGTLPQTGPGPGLYLLGFLGFLALGAASLLFVVERGRRLLVRADHRGVGTESHPSSDAGG